MIACVASLAGSNTGKRPISALTFVGYTDTSASAANMMMMGYRMAVMAAASMVGSVTVMRAIGSPNPQ